MASWLQVFLIVVVTAITVSIISYFMSKRINKMREKGKIVSSRKSKRESAALVEETNMNREKSLKNIYILYYLILEEIISGWDLMLENNNKDIDHLIKKRDSKIKIVKNSSEFIRVSIEYPETLSFLNSLSKTRPTIWKKEFSNEYSKYKKFYVHTKSYDEKQIKNMKSLLGIE